MWLLILLFCYTGRIGDTGPMGYHGKDGQKGIRGDIGLSIEGQPGEKGTNSW